MKHKAWVWRGRAVIYNIHQVSWIWDKLLRPIAFRFDAEHAHELGIRALERGLARPFYVDDPTFGRPPVPCLGLEFTNPVGIAAGFDKNGVVVEQLAALGFGFVEVGTVTFKPQPGNPRPRLFRLPMDRALINRLGFNNDGAAVVAERLGRISRPCVIGVNIGRNKNVPNDEAVENYLAAFKVLHPVADYLAVNVSSPNTPGLRDLQHGDHLYRLLAALQDLNEKLGKKPLLVKIAPDLNDNEIAEIVAACRGCGVSGMIATNTTTSRESLITPDVERFGAGGVSGLPLRKMSDSVISRIRSISEASIPVIGVGGIFSGEDALEKLAAGASLVQTYTGFVYTGPNFPKLVNRYLAAHA